MTAKLTKKSHKTLRFILASAFGGAYSLIILADLSEVISALLKCVAAGVIVLIAFSFRRVTSFLTAYALFFFVSFLFLGVVYGLALITKTPYITLSNSTVYVNVSARGLIVSSFIAYVISCVVVRVYNRSLAAGELYSITVENGGETVNLFALSDTGNRLREPFSDAPVIIADSEKVKPLFSENNARVIPASTANSKSFMLSFKPERVTISTDRGSETVDNVYIALSDEMKNDGFSAVLNPEILTL